MTEKLTTCERISYTVAERCCRAEAVDSLDGLLRCLLLLNLGLESDMAYDSDESDVAESDRLDEDETERLEDRLRLLILFERLLEVDWPAALFFLLLVLEFLLLPSATLLRLLRR
jgi:hypothetical protein